MTGGSPSLRKRAGDLSALAAAYGRTLYLHRRLRTRQAIERHHATRLKALQAHLVRETPFYRSFAGRPFAEWPVMDKAAQLAAFDRLNVTGIDLATVREALERGEGHVGGYAVGRSTGTSGNRGYYLVTDRERFTWLGTLLAKALPGAPFRRHRAALALPGYSSLYGAASSRLTLGLFDLSRGIEALIPDIAGFRADVIVAPPKVLRALADEGRLTQRHVFSGAEVLDPLDRAAIERATGRPAREIYMATEGLFAVSCPHGRLHLCEDVVHFGWEREPGSPDLRVPIVTDFTRRASALVRYRMNDLLALDDTRCACGLAFQGVKRIEGRSDDVFLLAAPDGHLRRITPDILRNAVVDADPSILDFRIVQTGPNAVEVRLAEGLPPHVASGVREALQRIVHNAGLLPLDLSIIEGIKTPYDRKLRRVRREWSP